MAGRGLPTGVGMTALYVVLERRVENARTDRLFHDPFAARFLTALRGAPSMAATAAFSNVSGFLRGYIPLRTWFYDTCALEAARTTCRQVVLLGGGLDTRAFRLQWPEGTRVFDVDSPAMLALQADVVASAHPTCYRSPVAVEDLSGLRTALHSAGFNPDEPTAWVLEGLLSRLSEAENDEVMAEITGLSASGSRLVADHFNHAIRRNPRFCVAEQLLTVLGPIWKSAKDDVIAWLATYGWNAQVMSPDRPAATAARRLPPVLDRHLVDPGRVWFVRAAITRP
ncbi:SAM-dependent methyltransferase [Nocardia sp. NRRL S-836]|uniref:SAM-dependent methyltransferase n=1 Tax=Nocardia sp. NRRL S-836 TaxID=1519492 RepID=UPI0006C18737|nr:SAM-dependent methyltransferase [Nocardia sp. NRRL S-836]KOV86338.1 hypothetical protein ADL03_09380 [Nocardia sp. NRRL S-836]